MHWRIELREEMNLKIQKLGGVIKNETTVKPEEEEEAKDERLKDRLRDLGYLE